MVQAADKLKNVNRDIKIGIPELIEAIEVIQQEGEPTDCAQVSRLSTARHQAQRSHSTPRRTSVKRTALSPAENQGATPMDKRIKDVASPPMWADVTR